MTISAVAANGSIDIKVGPNNTQLAWNGYDVSIISGDTESAPIDVRGFRSLGLSNPVFATATSAAVHVSLTKTGTYRPLFDGATAVTFDLSRAGADDTLKIAPWGWAKLVYNVNPAETISVQVALS